MNLKQRIEKLHKNIVGPAFAILFKNGARLIMGKRELWKEVSKVGDGMPSDLYERLKSEHSKRNLDADAEKVLLVMDIVDPNNEIKVWVNGEIVAVKKSEFSQRFGALHS